MIILKTKAAGVQAKAASKTTNYSNNSKPFNTKAQRNVPRECLPSPFLYYKKIFPNIILGSEWVSVRCVFHNDSNPSLSINLKNGGFNCFSCGAKGGDLIAFHQKHFNLGFHQSLLQLKSIKKRETK